MQKLGDDDIDNKNDSDKHLEMSDIMRSILS
jgi:hypothetical protein